MMADALLMSHSPRKVSSATSPPTTSLSMTPGVLALSIGPPRSGESDRTQGTRGIAIPQKGRNHVPVRGSTRCHPRLRRGWYRPSAALPADEIQVVRVVAPISCATVRAGSRRSGARCEAIDLLAGWAQGELGLHRI